MSEPYCNCQATIEGVFDNALLTPHERFVILALAARPTALKRELAEMTGIPFGGSLDRAIAGARTKSPHHFAHHKPHHGGRGKRREPPINAGLETTPEPHQKPHQKPHQETAPDKRGPYKARARDACGRANRTPFGGTSYEEVSTSPSPPPRLVVAPEEEEAWASGPLNGSTIDLSSRLAMIINPLTQPIHEARIALESIAKATSAEATSLAMAELIGARAEGQTITRPVNFLRSRAQHIHRAESAPLSARENGRRGGIALRMIAERESRESANG